MDKLDRILKNSAHRATDALPLDGMWESLQKAAQARRQRRKLLLRQVSMAAMLVVGLGAGIVLGRSPLLPPTYAIVEPPAPIESIPDSTVVDPPGDPEVPDVIVIDPPKTDPGTPEEVFVEMREFKHLPQTGSIKDLLPGWLPDVLQDQRLTQDVPENRWMLEGSDTDQFFTLGVVSQGNIQAMFNERENLLPEGITAETLPVGTGVLLRFAEDEGPIFREMWYLRTGDYSYAECIVDGLLPEDVLKIIDNLGK